MENSLYPRVEANIAKLGKPFVSFPVATAMKLKASDITDAHPEASVHERTDGPTRKTVMINFAGAKFRKYPSAVVRRIVQNFECYLNVQDTLFGKLPL